MMTTVELDMFRRARMATRKNTPKPTETNVLHKSQRRCCLCVYLRNDQAVKKGQIAHLNRNPLDDREENLVYLCLEHHDEYDTRTSVSKGLTDDEVKGYRDLLYERNQPSPPMIRFNVPFQRNTFFTGREEILAQVHEALAESVSVAVSQKTSHAISGLGGVGKTQIAVEYAYRHRDEYQAVLWVGASDESTLASGYSEIARLLSLPQKDLNDQRLVIDGVKRWLDSNKGWLLILDNADDPKVLPTFMPGDPKGRILITSRAEELQEVGIPKPLRLDAMLPDEALDFVLRRTARDDADDSEIEAAKSLAKELEYLPLALEQAAAYIVEKRPKFAAYLTAYGQRQLDLLESHKPLMGDYPRSVVTTWDANFEAVGEASPAAADVLRLSAMLAPEEIPYETLAKGGQKLGAEIAKALAGYPKDPLALDELLAHLSRYSLIRRGEDGWSVHRLVQAVVREHMTEDERRAWAERAVNAVNAATPGVEFSDWPLCERLLPHQQRCFDHVEKYGIETAAAAGMLNQAAYYAEARAFYHAAEPLCRRALAICEKVFGTEHRDTATTLNNLAILLKDRGDLDTAEPLLRRALEIREKVLGPEHPGTATTLNNLAMLLQARGDLDAAESLFRRALDIKEKTVGPHHPSTATSLNNLALLLKDRGDLDTAEPLLRRALAIDEKAYGPDHPEVATDLNNLALLLKARGDLAAAEPLYRRALAIDEKAYGPDHPEVATDLNNLALLLTDRGDLDAAEPLLRRALKIREKVLAPEHPRTRTCRRNLEMLLQEQRRTSNIQHPTSNAGEPNT